MTKRLHGILKRAMQVVGILFLMLINTEAVFAAALEVDVQHIQNNEGHLAVGLYMEDGYPDAGKEFRGAYIPPKGTNTVYIFQDLPPGRYAVAVYHDENDNKILDKNLFGIPKENYGFSHGETVRYGAPDFVDAAIEFPSVSRVTVVLK